MVKSIATIDKKMEQGPQILCHISFCNSRLGALDAAIQDATNYGLHFAIPAGDDNSDAYKYSPTAKQSIPVGATNMTDERAYFSDYGKYVDAFVPGMAIQSACIGSKHAMNVVSFKLEPDRHHQPILPNCMAAFIPASFVEHSVPFWTSTDLLYNTGGTFDVTQFGGITPAQLKATLIDFAMEAKLKGVPENTPNLVIVNHATSA